jgi:mono/diheme cytochrome c family protein
MKKRMTTEMRTRTTTTRTNMRRQSPAAKWIAIAALAIAPSANLAIAQSSDAPHFKKDVYVELSKAPKKAVARRNPLAQDPDAVAAGGKLFEEHCAECHGDMADGGKKGPSLRADEVQQSTPGALFWLLTNGVVRRGMPVWSKLPEPQRWQLVSYIKSLTPAAQPSSSSDKATHP